MAPACTASDEVQSSPTVAKLQQGKIIRKINRKEKQLLGTEHSWWRHRDNVDNTKLVSFYWSKDRKAISNRANVFFLACLRAGHARLLNAHDNLLDSLADPPCPLRKVKPQELEHWLWRCPRLDGTRQNIFGSPSPLVRALIPDPEMMLALPMVTLQSAKATNLIPGTQPRIAVKPTHTAFAEKSIGHLC